MTDIMILRTADQVRNLVSRWRSAGMRVGFVPTMGALHSGHLSLVKVALENADRVVISIFVNPSQFGPGEDLASYPGTYKEDVRKLEESGAHCVFYPAADEIYPDGFSTSIHVSGLTETLCGKYRPGHFEGVATVCAILFAIVKPDISVFGRKDAQQLAVIRRMVDDLRIGIEILAGEIVREPDGLAMSSRNVNLNQLERSQAAVISSGLQKAAELTAQGEKDAGRILDAARNVINTAQLASIQYLELVDIRTLKPIARLSTPALLAIAVYLGNTRLIDNTILIPSDS